MSPRAKSTTEEETGWMDKPEQQQQQSDVLPQQQTQQGQRQEQQQQNNDIDSMTSPKKNLNGTTGAGGGGGGSGGGLSKFKLLLLFLMVLQNSSTVLVGRYTRSSVPKDSLYVVNHLILVTELGKLILACGLEFMLTKGKLLESIKENIIDRPLDFLKVLVPSLLYLLQNSLLYVALSNLSAPLFQVTYQTKLLTTALVSVVMLQRRYKPKQWVCLTTLGIGVAIVVLGEKKQAEKEEVEAAAADADSDKPHQSLFIGLVSVSIACLSSALAGVYFEKMLKVATGEKNADGTLRQPVSMWMRNIQMAFFSVVIALVQRETLKEEEREKPFMHGFTIWVWILVGLQAGGGLLVAAVIKYADNVLKGLATGVSVVVATAFSMALFRTPLSMQFTFGASVILSSVYLFSNDFPGWSTVTMTKPSAEKKVEMQSLVLPK